MKATSSLLTGQVLELFEAGEVRLRGRTDCIITGVSEDSRKIEPGFCFVARSGNSSDGRAFIHHALERQASALLVEPGLGFDVDVPVLEAADVRKVYGRLSQELWGRPSEVVRTLGITGTNGKTTTAYLVESALRFLGERVCRMGTLGFFIDGQKVAETLTTSFPEELALHLAMARAQDVSFAVMEVSSHALTQRRVEGVRFTAAGFTNLTQDHLDYHGTMEAYERAKARLFVEHEPENVVVNLDDPAGRRYAELARTRPHPARVLGYSTRLDSIGAELSVRERRLSGEGITARVDVEGHEVVLSSPLVGQHNLENLLLALGLLLTLGVDPRRAADALRAARGAPGRLERVTDSRDDIAAFVDYAHTPDALARTLDALRAVGARSLICVFGCGGDRDPTKRPLMGAEASRAADRIVVTSDNPRTEDPAQIVTDIWQGVDASKATRVLDRRAAIRAAILDAEPGATVVVAGKGHESYQIIGPEKIHFDDVEEVGLALALRRARMSEKNGNASS